MNRPTRLLATGAAFALATSLAARYDRWRTTVYRVARVEDADRLLGLHARGLITAAEAVLVAHWSRGYEPTALLDALTRVLTTTTGVQRPLAKRAFLCAVAVEVGPHVPTLPRPAVTSPALSRF